MKKSSDVFENRFYISVNAELGDERSLFSRKIIVHDRNERRVHPKVSRRLKTDRNQKRQHARSKCEIKKKRNLMTNSSSQRWFCTPVALTSHVPRTLQTRTYLVHDGSDDVAVSQRVWHPAIACRPAATSPTSRNKARLKRERTNVMSGVYPFVYLLERH